MELRRLEKPFLCAVIAEPTCERAIEEIDKIESSDGGVGAFEINVAPLGLSHLSDIFTCTNRPCVATNRRAQFMRVYGYKSLRSIPDDLRADRLIKAFEQGARAIDFELDMFDENRTFPFGSKRETENALRRRSTPRQVTEDTNAIRKQRALIRRIKSNGGEVVISCHAQIRVNRQTVVRLARAIQGRGADFAKIVVMTFGYGDIVELQIAARALRYKVSIPFNLMNTGDYAVLGRLLSTLCGSAWVYCGVGSDHSYGGQPTIEEAKLFLRTNLPHNLKAP